MFNYGRFTSITIGEHYSIVYCFAIVISDIYINIFYKTVKSEATVCGIISIRKDIHKYPHGPRVPPRIIVYQTDSRKEKNKIKFMIGRCTYAVDVIRNSEIYGTLFYVYTCCALE